ncbi:hypothetical protein FRB97_008224 [Tulasnella sp. 331]|nr:hypothetical protein FRB97_008224 [Tulasnella sp. 331]
MALPKVVAFCDSIHTLIFVSSRPPTPSPPHCDEFGMIQFLELSQQPPTEPTKRKKRVLRWLVYFIRRALKMPRKRQHSQQPQNREEENEGHHSSLSAKVALPMEAVTVIVTPDASQDEHSMSEFLCASSSSCASTSPSTPSSFLDSDALRDLSSVRFSPPASWHPSNSEISLPRNFNPPGLYVAIYCS